MIKSEVGQALLGTRIKSGIHCPVRASTSRERIAYEGLEEEKREEHVGDPENNLKEHKCLERKFALECKAYLGFRLLSGRRRRPF